VRSEKNWHAHIYTINDKLLSPRDSHHTPASL
jgi:hypothetical protein